MPRGSFRAKNAPNYSETAEKLYPVTFDASIVFLKLGQNLEEIVLNIKELSQTVAKFWFASLRDF